VALYLCRYRVEIVRDPMKVCLDNRIGVAMRVVAYLFCMFSKVVEQTHRSAP
jgi:hypothetical protein